MNQALDKPRNSSVRVWFRIMPFLGWGTIVLMGRYSALKDQPALLLPIAVSAMLVTFLVAFAWRPRAAQPLHWTILGKAAGLAVSTVTALPKNARRMLFSIPGVAPVLVGIVSVHVAEGVLRGIKIFRRNKIGFRERIQMSLGEIVPERIAKLAATELSILRFTFCWRMSPHIPEGAKAFSYHKHLQAMLWAFFCLMLLEISVVHLLVSLWSPVAAWTLFAVSDISVLYLLGLINSLKKLPILVTDQGVLVRAGLLIEQFIPIEIIKGVTTSFDSNYLKSKQVLRTTLLAYPSLLIELHSPLVVAKSFGRFRKIVAVAIHPDDLSAFIDEIGRVRIARLDRYV